MVPLDWPSVISRFHKGPCRCGVMVTGGGASAIAQLLAVPGASNTILEALVPYAPPALDHLLGRPPEQYCSETTALAMAVVAFQRAARWQTPSSVDAPAAARLVGVSGTASLASSRPKRGPHRVHLALQTVDQTTAVFLDLAKGLRDRAGEEQLVSALVLQLLCDCAGIPRSEQPEVVLTAEDHLKTETIHAEPLLQELFGKTRKSAWSLPSGEVAVAPPQRPVGLLCGSFNPLHHGHKRLRDVAETRLKGLVGYELSIHNVDKPPLDFLTIARRRQQFEAQPLALTDAPTFLAKSRVLPGTVFVVGADTAERILDPKYCGGEAETIAALEEIRSRGCRILTAARQVEGRLHELRDIPVPPQFADLFEAIPASEFREDVSSSEIRKVEQSAS